MIHVVQASRVCFSLRREHSFHRVLIISLLGVTALLGPELMGIYEKRTLMVFSHYRGAGILRGRGVYNVLKNNGRKI